MKVFKAAMLCFLTSSDLNAASIYCSSTDGRTNFRVWFGDERGASGLAGPSHGFTFTQEEYEYGIILSKESDTTNAAVITSIDRTSGRYSMAFFDKNGTADYEFSHTGNCETQTRKF